MIDLKLLSQAVREKCGPDAALIGDTHVERADGTIVTVASLHLASVLNAITAAADRAAAFPNLEPDQFWFVVRASGHEQALIDWVAAMNDPAAANYDPVGWAQVSAKLDHAKFFERDHPLIEAARQALGISAAELDALWQYGAA